MYKTKCCLVFVLVQSCRVHKHNIISSGTGLKEPGRTGKGFKGVGGYKRNGSEAAVDNKLSAGIHNMTVGFW